MEKNIAFQNQIVKRSNVKITNLLTPYFYLAFSYLIVSIGFYQYQSAGPYFTGYNIYDYDHRYYFFRDYFEPQVFSLLLVSIGLSFIVLSLLFFIKFERSYFSIVHFTFIIIPGIFIFNSFLKLLSDTLFLCSISVFDLCGLQFAILTFPVLLTSIFILKISNSNNN